MTNTPYDNLDSESRLALLEGQKAQRLKESADWSWAKDKLELMMSALTSIATLGDYKTATALQSEIAARKKAVGIVRAWIEEVEGSGNQYEFNKEILKEQLIHQE